MAETVSPAVLYDEIADGRVPLILDLRNADDHLAGPVEGARPVPTRNVPVWRAMEALDELAATTPPGAVVVCGQGNGSLLVAEELAERGTPTRSLEGGTDAWARLLVPRELPLPLGALRAWQLLRPAKGCLSYVVGRPGGSCLVVDPARLLEPYRQLAAAYGMAVRHVVDTHLHADHISGGPALAAATGAAYHLPPEDAGPAVPFPNQPLHDGDVLDLGAGDGEALVTAMTMHLPGHTPGTTALLVGRRLLLVGDTVFVRGLGRPDLTGRAEELAQSLFHSVHERLRPLPPDTVIAPAHWSHPDEVGADGLVTTTVADVFAATLLSEQAMDRFVAEIVTSLPTAPETYETIRAVNAGRRLAPEEIEVLDVGRNQCAAATTTAQPTRR